MDFFVGKKSTIKEKIMEKVDEFCGKKSIVKEKIMENMDDLFSKRIKVSRQKEKTWKMQVFFYMSNKKVPTFKCKSIHPKGKKRIL